MKQGENCSNLQHFCQMIYGKCSIKMRTQFILIAQDNYVFGTFLYILAIDFLKNQFF